MRLTHAQRPNRPTARMRALLLVAAAFFAACSKAPAPKAIPLVEPEPPKGAEITFADVRGILTKNCVAGCHVAGGTAAGTPMDDLKRIQVSRPEIYASLISADPQTVMPQGNMAFKTSKDGAFLIEWVREGRDIVTETNTILSPGGSGKTGGAKTTGPVKANGPKAGGLPTLDQSVYGGLTFADVQDKVDTACGKCHKAGGTVAAAYEKWPFESAADFRETRNAVISALEKGKEPRGADLGTLPDDLKWLNSPGGKAIYGWLKFGQDFSAGM